MYFYFRNDDLGEKIYINQLEGFIEIGKENKFCKLVKSFYSIKQASMQHINAILCLYVYEILIFGSNISIFVVL